MSKNKSKIKQWDGKIVLIIGSVLIVLFSILCVFPFVMVISGSFTANETILQNGYKLIPQNFSLEAYKFIFDNPKKIVNAYKVTIIVTVVGTACSVFFTSMTAYVLSRNSFAYRGFFSFYFFFTTIFSGGLIPWYVLCVRYLRFKENPYMALIFTLLFNFFYIIILRTFMQSIPESLIESAKIDGAGEFYIFIKIIMPLSKPAIATIVLFVGMAYWNDYYNPMLFVSGDKYVPLQYYLYRIINAMESMNSEIASSGVMIQYPSESFKLAMTVVATGPIVFLYPFIQKYLIKGIMVGAVKG